MHRVQHNNTVDYRTNREKICPTKPTVQVLGYGTAQSKVNTTPLQIQKLQKYQKPHPIKKNFTVLIQQFPDLTHHHRQPSSLLALSLAFISASSPLQIFLLFLSSPSSSCFFFSLRFLGLLGTFRDLHPHIRGMQFSLVFVKFSLLFS